MSKTLGELAKELRATADQMEAVEKAWDEFARWAVPNTRQEAVLGEALKAAIEGKEP